MKSSLLLIIHHLAFIIHRLLTHSQAERSRPNSSASLRLKGRNSRSSSASARASSGVGPPFEPPACALPEEPVQPARAAVESAIPDREGLVPQGEVVIVVERRVNAGARGEVLHEGAGVRPHLLEKKQVDAPPAEALDPRREV